MTATRREAWEVGGGRHAARVPRPRRPVEPATQPIPRVDDTTTAIPLPGGMDVTEAIPRVDDAASAVTDPIAVVPPRDPAPFPRGNALVLVLATVVAVAMPGLASVSVAVPGRPVLAVLFMLLVPGVPVALFLRLPDRLLAANIALGTSLAANLLIATAVLQIGWWHPLVASWILTAVALAFGLAVLRRWVPRARGSAPTPSRAARSEPMPAAATGLRFRLVSACVLVAALIVWSIGVDQTNLDAAGVLGVASAVGWKYVVALALMMSMTAAALLRRQLDAIVLGLCAVTVTVALYGFVNLADGEASVATAWLHVGFIHYISDNGHVLASYDARFSWPGFFAAGAQLVSLAGVPDARPFLLLAPVAFNLLTLPAVYLIAVCVISSRRCAWATVFVVLCANWYEQDYFSPQAVCYVVYLIVIATMLWSFTQCPTNPVGGRGPRRLLCLARRMPGRPPGVSSGSSIGVGSVLLVMGAATVVSHQLTPVAIIIGMLTFVVCGATRYRSLWISLTLMMLAWYSYGATDFIFGHLGQVIGDVGQVQTTFTSAVTDRLTGNPTYLIAQQTRIAWSAGLFLTALLGAWFVRRRRDAVLIIGLALSPFTLMLLQSYGGEVLIRCFLYAMPFLATLAVVGLRGVVHARRAQGGRRRAGRRTDAPIAGRTLVGATAVTLTLMSFALTFTRGLNVSFERNPSGLLAASDYLLERIPTGAAVGTLRFPGILPYRRLGQYTALSLEQQFCGVPELECAIKDRPQFILITPTQDRLGELQAGLPRGWTSTIANELVARGIYTKVFANHDAEILKLAGER